MASTTPTNGQGTNRILETAKPPSEARRRSRSSRDKDARSSKPFDEQVRLCLNVPLHIVKRLEAHALAMGQSRDVFAEDCLDKHMRATYSKRDEYLRTAYNSVPDEPKESQPTGTPQGE
jgi:hypothetical protein